MAVQRMLPCVFGSVGCAHSSIKQPFGWPEIHVNAVAVVGGAVLQPLLLLAVVC